MCSTACWTWDAQPTSASPELAGAGVSAPTPLIRATQPRQPRYIRPLGEQPSRKFLSTRGGRRGLWVCPAVWLLGSISEQLKAEPAVAQDRERVCTDLTMAFVRWRAVSFTPSGPHSTA